MLSFFLLIIDYSVSEDLEGGGDELGAGGAAGTLPAVSAYFHCTGFSWTLNVARSSILFINPLLPPYKQRRTSMRTTTSTSHLRCKRLPKYVVAVHWELVTMGALFVCSLGLRIATKGVVYDVLSWEEVGLAQSTRVIQRRWFILG